MRRSEEREKYIIYTAAILLCLVMATFWLMSNIYARYVTSSSGEDGARVAQFNITESGTATSTINVTLQPGETEEYPVDVTNNSEVTIAYEIDVQNKYKNLPLETKMLDTNGNEITNNSSEISANDTKSHQYKLQISWPKDKQDEEYAGKTDQLEITLRAVQKD